MKLRIILVLGLMFFIGASLYAQKSGFEAGVILNFNGIQFEGQGKSYWDSNNGTVWGGGGISSGIFIKHNISKKLFAGFDFRYTQKGSIYEYTNEFAKPAFEVLRFNYFEIPIYIGTVLESEKRNYIFQGGLAYAEMFSSKFMIDEFARRHGTPSAENFKKHDFSLHSSLKFPIYKKRFDDLLFGVRTSYSFLSIHEIYKIYNFIYGIEISYQF
jgi:hypothetical protein